MRNHIGVNMKQCLHDQTYSSTLCSTGDVKLISRYPALSRKRFISNKNRVNSTCRATLQVDQSVLLSGEVTLIDRRFAHGRAKHIAFNTSLTRRINFTRLIIRAA